MKVKSAMIRLTGNALSESLPFELVQKVARRISSDYDIHRSTGIPANFPVTVQMAARQLAEDMSEAGQFLHLVEIMIDIDCNGFMGREHPIHYLPEIVKLIEAEGYTFDHSSGLFMENVAEGIHPNWGRLNEEEEHQAALLRLDIVDNSRLVRDNPREKVDQAYADLRAIVMRAVVSRLGRVWFWEGDGCLAGFLFNHKERAALKAGIEILHELFFYNLMKNPLASPIQVRLACHTGPVKYAESPGQLKKDETVQEVFAMESAHTPSDNLTTTQNMILSIDRMLQDHFRSSTVGPGEILRHYAIALEKA